MNHRILVVDDEPDVQQFLRLVLEGAGYAVECAGDGQEAIRKIALECPDLVVLDIMMPVMDGWAVLAWLRGRGAPPPVVVVLSALEDGARALEEGAAEYLAKPFRVEQLLAVCSRILAS
jgi:CheY-like chemotaxis protein